MEDFYKNVKTIDISCTKEKLLDYAWLFNNIPWINFDNTVAKACFDESIEIFYLNEHGFISNTSEIISKRFNNVIITSFHGTINHFSYTFKLDDEVVLSCDFDKFDYTKENLKERLTNSHERTISGLKKQILANEKYLEIIKSL